MLRFLKAKTPRIFATHHFPASLSPELFLSVVLLAQLRKNPQQVKILEIWDKSSRGSAQKLPRVCQAAVLRSVAECHLVGPAALPGGPQGWQGLGENRVVLGPRGVGAIWSRSLSLLPEMLGFLGSTEQ